MTFSGVFFSLIDIFFYIYIYYRIFNAEFNKLIKTVGHRALIFREMVLNTPTFANNFGYFQILTYQVLKFCALIGCHSTKGLQKMCKLFCCVSVRGFEPNISIIGVHLTIEKQLFDRKVFFL